MTATTFYNTPANAFQTRSEFALMSKLRRWTSILLVASILAVTSGLSGCALGLFTLIGIIESPLTLIGTLLLAASFPLFVLTAHCIDKIAATEKQIRLEYCRQHGLKDEDR